MQPQRQYKYYELVMAAFVTVYLCANLIGPAKPAEVALPTWLASIFGSPTFIFGAGVLFFPLSYVFGDILTEVYGYARARKVIWAGFGALIFASIMATVIVALPPAKGWPNQAAYENIFGQTPRIVVASLIAFFTGEFVNSFVLAKMKILTNGKHLWSRMIGSTILGEGVDTLIFYPLAFAGTWDNALLFSVMLGNYIMKVLWEVFATPLTYKIVAWLKHAEREDYYDRDTNFTPFSLET
jgi:queuosine precursor transporter